VTEYPRHHRALTTWKCLLFPKAAFPSLSSLISIFPRWRIAESVANMLTWCNDIRITASEPLVRASSSRTLTHGKHTQSSDVAAIREVSNRPIEQLGSARQSVRGNQCFMFDENSNPNFASLGDGVKSGLCA
jgi:hypothetical protein